MCPMWRKRLRSSWRCRCPRGSQRRQQGVRPGCNFAVYRADPPVLRRSPQGVPVKNLVLSLSLVSALFVAGAAAPAQAQAPAPAAKAPAAADAKAPPAAAKDASKADGKPAAALVDLNTATEAELK